MKIKIILLLTFLLTGCLELEQEFFLNPDGSGKVHYKIITSADSMVTFSSSDQEQTPDRKFQEFAKQEFEQSEGVYAWKEANVEYADEGQVKFTGIAYFSNFKNLKLHQAGISSLYTNYEYDYDQNQSSFHIVSKDKESNQAESNRDVDQEIKNYKAMREFIGDTIGKMKLKTIVNLPGKITSATNFDTYENNRAEFTFHGSKLVEYMDKAIEEPEVIKRISDESISEGEINKILLGTPGEIKAIAKGTQKALFDYKKEAKAARDGYEAMLAKLNLNTKIPVPVSDNAIPNVTATGIQKSYQVIVSKEDINLKPFFSDPGIQVALLFEFPGSITAFENVLLTSATTDSGEDILKSRSWDRKISFGNLSKDQSKVSIKAPFKLPTKPAKKFSIAGTVTYLVSPGTKEIDLGIKSLSLGSQGTKYAAKITKLEDDPWSNDKKQMTLSLNLDIKEVESIKFYDHNDLELDVQDSGYSGGMGNYKFLFRTSEDLPKKGKVVVNIYDQVKKYEANFKVSDIEL